MQPSSSKVNFLGLKNNYIYGCYLYKNIHYLHIEVLGEEQGLHCPWSEMTQLKQEEDGFGFYYSWDPRVMSILVHSQGLCGLNFSTDTQGVNPGLSY